MPTKDAPAISSSFLEAMKEALNGFYGGFSIIFAAKCLKCPWDDKIISNPDGRRGDGYKDRERERVR